MRVLAAIVLGSFFIGWAVGCGSIAPDPPIDASLPRRDAGADVSRWADAMLERILADGGLDVEQGPVGMPP